MKFSPRFSSLLLGLVAGPILAAQSPPPPEPVCNRVRFYPAAKGANLMVGGHISGSNVSRWSGYETLAEIKTAPPEGQWSELTFPNTKIYRWLRYEGPANGPGSIAELEFYAGDRKLSGRGNAFGTVIANAGRSWQNAFDEKTETTATTDTEGQLLVGIDLRDVASTHSPVFLPPAAGPSPVPGSPQPATEHDGPMDIVLKCSTPGAVIRYTLDGTWPTAENGIAYHDPIHLEKTTTIEAVSFLEGRAPSMPIFATYLIKGSTQPGYRTFHWGNSLTQTTGMFSQFCRTAGFRHESRIFARPGAWTKELWDIGLTKEKERADGLWNSLDHLDHLTLQPRDFNIEEEAGYDLKFINMARQKSPGVQPWLYCEWTEMLRQRPTDRGQVPSSEMKKLFPAQSWEESMGAMLLYVEELQRKIKETDHEGKAVRVLPSALMMGWVKNLVDTGRFPGVTPGTFYRTFFNDQVHPASAPTVAEHANGGYLVNLTWFSAFYGESPEGKVLPIGTTFTPEQTALLQKLAWSVIQNYADCGLYREGTIPCQPPKFGQVAGRDHEPTLITLTSETPEAWFRYTLDGTTPTRTNGYVYCGKITPQGGIHVKAVAYKSGMADSAVVDLP